MQATIWPSQPSRTNQSTPLTTKKISAASTRPWTSCPRPGKKKLHTAATTFPAEPCPDCCMPGRCSPCPVRAIPHSPAACNRTGSEEVSHGEPRRGTEVKFFGGDLLVAGAFSPAFFPASKTPRETRSLNPPAACAELRPEPVRAAGKAARPRSRSGGCPRSLRARSGSAPCKSPRVSSSDR